MRYLNKILFLCGTVLGLSTLASAVVGISDDFSTAGKTLPGWINVGAVAAQMDHDTVSAEDYDDGDSGAKLVYSNGMLITGDGVQGDGGLRFNTQNATAGDEAIALTIGGTMQEGEEIILSGSIYNDNSSYSDFNARLWNLTDGVLLAESGSVRVLGKGSNNYVPAGFSVSYIAGAADEGDELQIRILEGNNATARDIYIDNFSLSGASQTPVQARYPWDDTFWFSFYSTIGADSAYAVEHGTTGIGPYYGGLAGQVAPLAEAEALGVNFSYKVQLPSMAGFTAANSDSFDWPSDATLISEAMAVVDAVETNLNIVMWDLVPEELRHWKANEMNFIEVVTAAIRQADAYDRPIMMYEPNNRKTSSLVYTAPYLDICSKGTYVSAVNGGEFRHNRIWARWSMEQELGAISAANIHAVPWIMLHMAYDTQEGEEHLIEDWCRHDAYMGLIMGGKGISIWSGWRPRNSWTNDFQAYFDGYLSVGADLNQERNFAPVFLYGIEQPGVTHVVTAGPASLELVYPAGVTNTYPPVTYAMREYLGLQYLFMVNSATQAVTLTFNHVPDAARTDLFQGLESPASGGSFSITLDPYEVAGFRFDGYETWRDNNFTAQQVLDGEAGENADPDSDGRSNRDEFNAGTDPNLGTDFFQTDLTFSNDWKNIRFNTASNRFYNVDYSTNLAGGSWVPMLGNELGSGSDVSVTDTNDHPQIFYRTRATRP